MEDIQEKVMEAVKYISSMIDEKPTIGIVLGSGLGALAYEVQNPITIPYKDIPNFKCSGVEGHESKLIFGKLFDKNVVVMQGRVHYYEGFTMQEITLPIRVFALLGVETLITTNAAGAINPKFKAGDLMVITDHIKLCGDSPLIGPNAELLGPRFPVMKQVYSPELIMKFKKVADELKIPIQEGIYAFMPGPQYETAAEVRMLGILGASAVGMSTVPEVICAAHSGMRVLGISCITNQAYNESEAATHKDVLEVASTSEENFVSLVLDTINAM